MRQFNPQDGFGLIALIGLIAALAISAAGLTILMQNTMGFTYAEQTRTKAFNVSEGALNVAMSTLQAQWPKIATTPAVFPTPIFRGEYADSSYPDPASGDFITVSIFDNTSETGAISPSTSPVYDSGSPGAPTTPDNKMYIRATARVSNGVATIQGLVERTFWNPSLPRGVAAYSGGAIVGNAQGGGTMPKILVGLYGPPVTPGNPLGQATAYAAGGYEPLGIMQSGTIAVKTGAAVPELDKVVFPDIINGIKLTAMQGQGDRYFSGATAVADALASPRTEMGGPGLQGLTYIEPAAGTSGTCELPQNTVDTPALLFLTGGNNWNFTGGGHGAGTADAYGFFYTQGNCDFQHGTPTIHGSMIAAGDIGFIGTPQIEYDDRVWINMTQQWTLNVRLVPNTWRELSPGSTN